MIDSLKAKMNFLTKDFFKENFDKFVSDSLYLISLFQFKFLLSESSRKERE